MGIGIVFSILSMVVAGLVERDRREFSNTHPDSPPFSVMWLAPHLAIMGMCEAFLFIGQIEFFNKEFPENMRSIANALFSVSFAIANYLSSVLITVIQKTTSGGGTKPDWLTNDLNRGRLDLFYFVLAGMGLLNFFYFLFCASRYRYKTKMTIVDTEVGVDGSKLSSFHDVEMNSC